MFSLQLRPPDCTAMYARPRFTNVQHLTGKSDDTMTLNFLRMMRFCLFPVAESIRSTQVLCSQSRAVRSQWLR